MPAVVTKAPPSMDLLLGGIAGALQGKIEGEKYVEDKRRFDEQMALENAKFEQSKVQWDQDMEYRYEQLNQMALDNKLDRTQRDALAKMADIRERYIFDRGLQFEENVRMPWTANQNELNRAVERRGQDRVYSASVYATKKAFDANMSQLQMEKSRLQTQEGYDVTHAQAALQGRDFKVLTPDEQDLVIKDLADRYIGEARANGSISDQPSDAERIQYLQRAKDTLTNYDTLYNSYIKQYADLHTSMRANEAGEHKALKGSIDPRYYYDTNTSTPENQQYISVWGVMPRNKEMMSPMDIRADESIRMMVLSATDAARMGRVPIDGVENLGKTMLAKTSEILSDNLCNDQQNYDYYKSLITHAVNNLIEGNSGVSAAQMPYGSTTR